MVHIKQIDKILGTYQNILDKFLNARSLADAHKMIQISFFLPDPYSG